ncbi:MAG: hypothetical protein QOH21_1179 [Acidobacteriota bacterium]|jgi:hypothetical protein|nr:hypothetical protein [Acidobacteriota bacterium]
MSSFILRILFSGLMAFVPSEDGKEVTVLLLNVGHEYHTSDGASLAHHKPLIITRAGGCTGDCTNNDIDIAQYIYADKSASAAVDALQDATGNGAAWLLSGSELSLRKGSTNAADLPELTIQQNVRTSSGGNLSLIPSTAAEREDFSWIADLKQVCGSGCTLDASVLADPPPGLIAARFRLKSGKLFTYSVVRNGNSVQPVHFQRLDGTGTPATYQQAVASWVAADIEIDGEDIELVEEKFDGSTGRSMKLTPFSNGKMEMAVLNLPPFVPPTATTNAAPGAGTHFEAYYDLLSTPPAQAARLVPFAGPTSTAPSYPDVSWSTVHPSTALWSDLLAKLRLDVGRGPYDRVICPPIKP